MPTPAQETVNACGQNVTNIMTYNIEATGLDKAIHHILAAKDMQGQASTSFAIRIGQGTARLTEGISLANRTKVLLLGHSLVNSTDIWTTIDLQKDHINVINSNVCFQDLHLTNGQVLGIWSFC